MRPSSQERHLLNLLAFVVISAAMIVSGAPAWALWLLGYIYICVVE